MVSNFLRHCLCARARKREESGAGGRWIRNREGALEEAEWGREYEWVLGRRGEV